MGGSRGSDTPSVSLSELQKKREEREKKDEYETEVNEYLQSLLKNINKRDIEKVHQHLEGLKTALEKDIEGAIEMRFGGSVIKHTYANGLSDIDMLVQISNSSYKNMSPREVLKAFAEQIKSRLPYTEVTVGRLAVTVKYSSGHEIQLLPAFKTQTGYKIPSFNKDKWSSVIKPHKFAEKLTKVNRDNSNKVVPLIKLIKNINATLPSSKQLSGYHIESIAIDAFKNPTNTPRTYKGMVEHFVNHSCHAVLNPIKDNTGQSVHVDTYLGSRNSLERRQISQTLKMLQKTIKAANVTNTFSNWRTILGVE